MVLVSLARAGIPIGILLKHYFLLRHGVDVPHYAISIIRGKGIDHNAMKYILSRHKPEHIQFVDGWTGKGAIKTQLDEAMKDHPGVSPGLVVLADPARIAEHRGTDSDMLVASACLNSTVTGLISRTVHRPDLIGPDDFHGAAYYENLLPHDLTYQFIGMVESYMFSGSSLSPSEELARIKKLFRISDINRIKPGIGETTRVLLRRVPWTVLVNSTSDYQNLGHIYQLAKERDVPILKFPLHNYRAVGLVRKVADA